MISVKPDLRVAVGPKPTRLWPPSPPLLAADAVLAEIEQAQAMGITGVPFSVLEGKHAISGAQDQETLADPIRQVAAMKAGGTLAAE